MKTNELRIGNLVEGVTGQLYHVTGIFFDEKDDPFINFSPIRNDVGWNKVKGLGVLHGDVKNFKPIPLTEEWLLKLGFVKDDNFGNWHLNHLEIYKKDLSVIGIDNKGNIYWYFYAADDYYSWTQKLDYVNQLQNLYFALTGKELTI